MHRCEQLTDSKLLAMPTRMQHALELAGRYPTAGGHLVSNSNQLIDACGVIAFHILGQDAREPGWDSVFVTL